MKLPNFDTTARLTEAEGMPTSLTSMFLDAIQKWIRSNGGTIYGTSAQRTTPSTRGYIAPANVADGTLYVETDTWLVYQIRSGVWEALRTLYRRTQAQLAALAAGLGADDAGILVEVSDYAHVLRWTGTAWEWGPGELGSGMMTMFEVDPTGVGWHLYDGATVNYLKSDGTTGSKTLPNLAGTAAYPKAGSPNSGPNAETPPTLTGGTIAAAATGVTAATSATATTTTIQNGAGVNVVLPSQAHVHAVVVTDPTHTHTISGLAASTAGEPVNLVRRPFFRQ